MKLLTSFATIATLFTLTAGFKTHTHKTASVDVKASDIIGTYWTEERDAKVYVFLAKNGKYSAKTVWMKEPNNPDGTPKRDIENPNKNLRHKTRLGLVFLKYFEFDASEKKWVNGSVYDPRSGKTYDGYLKFEGDNKNELSLRGYISGMSWLGKTTVWTRVK